MKCDIFRKAQSQKLSTLSLTRDVVIRQFPRLSFFRYLTGLCGQKDRLRSFFVDMRKRIVFECGQQICSPNSLIDFVAYPLASMILTRSQVAVAHWAA